MSLDHWILHPNLLGISIKVEITGGELDTSRKKDGVFVETVASEFGISVVCRRFNQSVVVPYKFIESSRQRPNPAREKGLMVVARNHPEHIGKLVRRIHHFYVESKTEENHWLIMQTFKRTGFLDADDGLLELHPNDLEYVHETPDQRRLATALLRARRGDYVYEEVQVRRS